MFQIIDFSEPISNHPLLVYFQLFFQLAPLKKSKIQFFPVDSLATQWWYRNRFREVRHGGFGGAFWEGLDAYLGGLLSILAIQNTYETTYETI